MMEHAPKPLDDRSATIETYRRSAESLAEKFDAIGVRAEDIKRAFELLGDKDKPKVVELGCGNGRDAAEILKYTDDFLGMDVSDKMIELAKNNNLAGKFVAADLKDFEIPTETDIVFAFASLLHSPKEEVADVLRRAHNSLNERGIFYISLKKAEYAKKDQVDEFGFRTFYYYEPRDIKELAGAAYESVYEDTQTVGHTEWFTLALRKVQ